MIAWLVPVSWACGPDFPMLMLEHRGDSLLDLAEGSFQYEAAHLVAATGRYENPADDADRSSFERHGLSDEAWVQVQQVRQAPTDAEAWALADGLEADVRLYTVGAADWHHGDQTTACERFSAVLALPEPVDRYRRGVAAAFMVARCDDGDPEQAWERVRTLVEEEGLSDPAGLALASFGEQARQRMWRGDWKGAVALYAAQAARGSTSGADSLLFVARWVAADDRRLTAALEDPLFRRLMVVYGWTRNPELGSVVGSPNPGAVPVTSASLLAALEGSGAVDGADHLAALAYESGRYDLAERWVALSSSALGSWVRAKLALRAGDLDAAAQAYVQAAVAFPPDPLVVYDDELYLTRCRLQGERGALALARSEYTEALSVLLDAARAVPRDWWVGPGWEDAAYVAERVLTVDELRAFVDRQTVSPGDPIGSELRALLARRLVRNGRAADAVRYFDDPELRAAASAYGDALDRTRRGSRIERAKAWLDAAELARPGLHLLGTEVQPDYGVFDGDFDRTWGDPPPAVDPAFRTADEQARVAASAPSPDERFHYRIVASAHAERAADLLPTTSQAYVVALCRAARYVETRTPERADALWQRYVATGPLLREPMEFGWRCPEPDWASAEERVRQDRWTLAQPVGGTMLALAGLAVVGLALRRVRRDGDPV